MKIIITRKTKLSPLLTVKCPQNTYQGGITVKACVQYVQGIRYKNNYRSTSRLSLHKIMTPGMTMRNVNRQNSLRRGGVLPSP